MSPEIAQAINAELSFILKPGWNLKNDGTRFVVSPPDDALNVEKVSQELEDEVWRVARFVAYAAFVSISKSGDGSYTIASHMESGTGFTILFVSK